MVSNPENTINKTNWNFILNSFANLRLGDKHVNRYSPVNEKESEKIRT